MDSGGGAIYTFAPDGSDFTKVITGGINPFWSPDGSQIAYLVPFDAPLEGDSPGLAIADADGSNVRTFGFAASGPWHPGAPAVDEPTPMADPTTSTATSPGSSGFTSTIHGLSINVPSGWQTRPATEAWTDGELDFDSPAADIIFHPALGDRLYFVLASQPFEGPTEAVDWDGTAPGDWDGLNNVHLCLPGEGGHGLGGLSRSTVAVHSSSRRAAAMP